MRMVENLLDGYYYFSGYFSPNFAIKFSYSSLPIFSSNSFSSIFSFLWSPKRSCGDATANNIMSPPICQANCRNSDCQFSAVCLKNSFQKAFISNGCTCYFWSDTNWLYAFIQCISHEMAKNMTVTYR